MQPINLESEFHSNRAKIILNIDEISKILNLMKSEICSDNIFEFQIPKFDNYQTVTEII